jgi:hypothetical protein
MAIDCAFETKAMALSISKKSSVYKRAKHN